MGKVSELSMLVDELKKCGETLIGISEELTELFSSAELEKQPVKKSAAKKKESEPPAEKELTLEEAFLRLEEVTRALEDENISLEESFAVYQKGMELLKYCNESIDKVEKKVLVLNGEGKLDEF